MAAEEPEINDRIDDHSGSGSEGEGVDLRNDSVTDSSEEDEDDEDEEAIQKVREGFIVDDDDDGDEEDDDDDDNVGVQSKKRKKHKKRRRERERSAEDDALDEDDLELLLENSGAKPIRLDGGNKFKRLKRRQAEDDEVEGDAIGGENSEAQSQSHFQRGLQNIFSEDEDSGDDLEGNDDLANNRRLPAGPGEEFDDFIELEDDSDDDAETRAQRQVERQKSKQKEKKFDMSKLTDVDRRSLQELFEVFGNGEEYAWALEAQEAAMDDEIDNEEPTTLEAVFENSELKERMLTEEDNLIRIIDMPERYQKYRSALTYIDLDEDELALEKEWVADILFNEKRGLYNEYEREFKDAVGQVVDLIAKEAYEVPFIWANRRDATLYTVIDPVSKNELVTKLLYEDDLWRIVQLDLEYHSLYEKRLNIEKLVDVLKIDDDLTKDIKSINTMVAIQDIHDYINFTYTKEIQEAGSVAAAAAVAANANTDVDQNGELKDAKNRKHSKYALFERIRSNILYDAVKAYGITAKAFGENVQDQSAGDFERAYRLHATDDNTETPEYMIDKLIDDDEVLFKDEKTARDAVRRTFAEEIFHNPKVRQEVRSTYKSFALISVALTEKGRIGIDNFSPYADIKYAINRSPQDLVSEPNVFLRMLEAEEKGLAVIKIETANFENWFEAIFKCLKSDGLSEVSDLWNKERELVLRMAFQKLCGMVALNTKEDLRRECQRLVAREVRKRFYNKLDQAPFTPYGYDLGTVPNVLSLTFGQGDYDSAVLGALLRDSGEVKDFFKSIINPINSRENEESFGGQLKEFLDKNLEHNRPDVIVISGYNANTKKLFDIVKRFVQSNRILVNTEGTSLQNNEQEAPLLPVIWGQDETARLYQNSDRARLAFPEKPTLVKYAIGVAKYVQNPLLEYISLGDDILSLTFHQDQKLIPKDMVRDALESAYVDAVNTLGVDINVAIRDRYVAQMLQYVAGFGPRKASGLLRNMESKLITSLATRQDLIELELTPLKIFQNCASFLKIPYDETDNISSSSIELLDATRIHPEDYLLAKKIAADVLELDEEDFDEDTNVIAQLNAADASKIEVSMASLDYNHYGLQIQQQQGKKKFATLRVIKEELVNNYEELRGKYHELTDQEAFNMLTGETRATFGRDAIVPVTVLKLGRNYQDPSAPIRWAKVVTSSLIQANVEQDKIRDMDLEQGKTYQAVILEVFYDTFTADMSLLAEDIKRASIPRIDKVGGKWNFRAEEDDWKKENEKEKAKKALTRNIQHPLYRNFNYKQAEEFLAPQNLGDCVIRPSSRGPDFLTITWKVGNNLFQHLLVEERKRGRKEYIVEGKSYSDLDQLIFQHIQAISKKVDDLVRSPKFREGTLAEVHDWLESYTKANPKSSAYVFCYDHKVPGSFLLLFKVNVNTPIVTWHVKTITEGYTLKGLNFSSVMNLCNGFKQAFIAELEKSKQRFSSGNGAGGNHGHAHSTGRHNYGYKY